MGVLGAEPQLCRCYEKYQDFQKLVELKDSGLVVYCHSRRIENVKQQVGVVLENTLKTSSQNVFILHNTKDVKITPSDFTPELEKKNIDCPRCRKMLRHGQALMQKVTSIDKKAVVGVCDHCQAKAIKKTCCTCDETVTKFLSVKGQQKDDTKKYIKIWLSRMGMFLKDALTPDKAKHVHSFTHSFSELENNRLHLHSASSRHEPEVEQMFYTETNKSEAHLITDVSDIDLKEKENINQSVTFIQPLERIETSPTETPQENIIIPGPKLVGSDATYVETYNVDEKLIKSSLKYRKQDREVSYHYDDPAMNAKEAMKRRHDLNLRHIMSRVKDSRYSALKRPEIYETTKMAPWDQKKSTLGYHKSDHDASRDIEHTVKEQVKPSSQKILRVPDKIKKGMYDLKENERMKQNDRYPSDEVLKLQRSDAKLHHKIKNPDQLINLPKTSNAEYIENIIEPNVVFFFSQPEEEEGELIKRDTSSSELIKNTQERLHLQAEETKRQQEERKQRIEEHQKEKLAKKRQAVPVQGKYSDKDLLIKSVSDNEEKQIEYKKDRLKKDREKIEARNILGSELKGKISKESMYETEIREKLDETMANIKSKPEQRRKADEGLERSKKDSKLKAEQTYKTDEDLQKDKYDLKLKPKQRDKIRETREEVKKEIKPKPDEPRDKFDQVSEKAKKDSKGITGKAIDSSKKGLERKSESKDKLPVQAKLDKSKTKQLDKTYETPDRDRKDFKTQSEQKEKPERDAKLQREKLSREKLITKEKYVEASKEKESSYKKEEIQKESLKKQADKGQSGKTLESNKEKEASSKKEQVPKEAPNKQAAKEQSEKKIESSSEKEKPSKKEGIQREKQAISEQSKKKMETNIEKEASPKRREIQNKTEDVQATKIRPGKGIESSKEKEAPSKKEEIQKVSREMRAAKSEPEKEIESSKEKEAPSKKGDIQKVTREKQTAKLEPEKRIESSKATETPSKKEEIQKVTREKQTAKSEPEKKIESSKEKEAPSQKGDIQKVTREKQTTRSDLEKEVESRKTTESTSKKGEIPKKVPPTTTEKEKLAREKEDTDRLMQVGQLRKEKEARKKEETLEEQAKEKLESIKEKDAVPPKKGKVFGKERKVSAEIEVSLSKIQKSINKSKSQKDLAIALIKDGSAKAKIDPQEAAKKAAEDAQFKKDEAEFRRLQAEHLKQREEALQKKKQEEIVAAKAKAVAEKKQKEEAALFDVKMADIKIVNVSTDDLILRLVKIKKALTDHGKIDPLIIQDHKCHHDIGQFSTKCPICMDSDLDIAVQSIDNKINAKAEEITDIIIGEKIFKYKPPPEKSKELEVVPLLFQLKVLPDTGSPRKEIVQLIPQDEELKTKEPRTKMDSKEIDEPGRGIIRYALSDRTFIDKGWTMLPTEKVMRKINVYRMRPAHPEFDWFEHNKSKRVMTYDTGEKLAEFDDNGRGRWYYRSGQLALDYYDAEETNAQQRFVIYSSGEPDERGRTYPVTILATFDYLGNGVVFDHTGKIRLKYNQTEGVVLDRQIGPVSHWKWHTLNDPPVLQQVMIDTQMTHKDPKILKMGTPSETVSRQENEEMLTIEFDNFIKEKSKKLSQKFKPFQIKMKALKINEYFSLRVLDQATIYLHFRDGSTNLKLNIGMILDHKEIVDTDTAEVGEVSNSLERFPARTDSLAGLQRSVEFAQRYERQRSERERRLKRPKPCASADIMKAAISSPLRPPLTTVPATSSGSCTETSSGYRLNRKPSSNLYYNTRL